MKSKDHLNFVSYFPPRRNTKYSLRTNHSFSYKNTAHHTFRFDFRQTNQDWKINNDKLLIYEPFVVSWADVFLVATFYFRLPTKTRVNTRHKIIKHEHPTRKSISGFAASLYFMTKYYKPRVFVNLRWPGPDFHLRGAFSSSPFQTARNFVMLASNLELNFSFEGLQSTSVQKCTDLDARLRLVNGMKCPAKS